MGYSPRGQKELDTTEYTILRVKEEKRNREPGCRGGGGLFTKSYLTRVTPMDCSPPGSSVHGIFQARVLEWGAIAFSEVSN